MENEDITEAINDLIDGASRNNGSYNQDNGQNSPPPPPKSGGIDFSKFGIAMLPVTPVPFTGNGALFAWGRLIGYGALTAMLYNRNKKAAMITGTAAALSLLTSLSAKSWDNEPKT